MNVPGLIAIIVFYLVILIVGIWAARKKKKHEDSDEINKDEILLAGRSIGCFVGTFTMTATWVGGGYINGTSESVYTSGLTSAQAPWGYALSLIFGGILFARKMRESGYVTMLDPLQEKYGKMMGGIIYIPALIGETFWSAAIFGSLGATLSVILGLHIDYAVIVSAVIAVGYTFFGGLYSVAYTDVVQLVCIFFGLWITVPFAMTHDHVQKLSYTQQNWIGTIKMEEIGKWADSGLLLVFGGIPWQVYFQRVLSSKSAQYAQTLSFAAAFGCIIMAIPSVLIGAVARSADWKSVVPENNTIISSTGEINDPRLVLPMVLHYLTPTWVSFFGLGAVSAAVMSSADSSVLSASSMFGYNIYKMAFRQKASEKELTWVIRIGIILVGGVSTAMGLTITRIYDLWVLSSDIVYVCLFPQLLCAVYFKFVNVHGSLAAFIVALTLRTLGGEAVLGIPVIIRYPFYDGKQQLFPFRTFAMGCSLLTLVVVSMISSCLFSSKHDRYRRGEVDIVRIKFKEPEREQVLSYSKISRLSGSYNSITASASELRNRDDRSLLKTSLTRTNPAKPIQEGEIDDLTM